MIPEPSAESLAADEQKFAAALAANTAADTERRRQYEAALQDAPPTNTPNTSNDPNAGPSPQPGRSPNVRDPLDNSQSQP